MPNMSARELDPYTTEIPAMRFGELYQYTMFRSVACSPGGLLVAAGGVTSPTDLKSHRGIIFVWNAKTGQQISRINPHLEDVACVSFSPDGHFLVSSGWWGNIEIWDVVTGAMVVRIYQPEFMVMSVEFSPYGFYIASGSQRSFFQGGELVLWPVAGMLVPHPFPPPWLVDKEFNGARW
jgi:WD40 repeat protein